VNPQTDRHRLHRAWRGASQCRGRRATTSHPSRLCSKRNAPAQLTERLIASAAKLPQFAYGLHPLTPLLLARRLLSGAIAASPQPAAATPA